MSCLNLRLPPARKAWKSFTSKLQIKLLHKLTKSKAIKKHKSQVKRVSGKNPRKSSFFLTRRVGFKKRTITPNNYHHYIGRYNLKNKSTSSPVYVDKLFKGPVVGLDAARNIKLLAQEATSEEEVTDHYRSVADDMWESVGLTSPQMLGIDQRAENFIVRFRAEMELQETSTRHS
ncbi:uncharacterized protein [Rutidosis leptorrhynchoides]|uniref:uncharacterized protein n=1 Tax=Rutidosis leptorrhynchoides TaxID=125765 RepID=UPI003A994F43